MDWSEHYLQNHYKYKQMVQEPSLSSIYENVDYLVAGMDESHLVQQRAREDEKRGNSTFRPSFVGRELHREHLTWEGFRNNFDSLTNKEYLREDFHSEVRQSLVETTDEFIHDRDINDHVIGDIYGKRSSNSKEVATLKRMTGRQEVEVDDQEDPDNVLD